MRPGKLGWVAALCSSQNAPCRPQPTTITFTGSAKTFSDRAATKLATDQMITWRVDHECELGRTSQHAAAGGAAEALSYRTDADAAR